MGVPPSRRQRSTGAPACLHYLARIKTRCASRTSCDHKPRTEGLRARLVAQTLCFRISLRMEPKRAPEGRETTQILTRLPCTGSWAAYWRMSGCSAKSPDQWNVIETRLSRKEIASENSNPLCHKLLQAAAVSFRATRSNGVHIGKRSPWLAAT
jgi:hypothetical protein